MYIMKNVDSWKKNKKEKKKSEGKGEKEEVNGKRNRM